MRRITDYSPATQLVVYVALLSGVAGLFGVVSSISTQSPRQLSPAQEKEAARIRFCKTVIDVVKSDDPTCGKDISRIKTELAAEKAAAAHQANIRRLAEQKASDPMRELTDIQLAACVGVLKSSMKDPRSFHVNEKTKSSGGLVDYTATNSFGGPVREVRRCTTMEILTQ